MQVQKNVGKPSNDTRPRTSTTKYTIKQRRRLPPSMNILKIATLNINGIHTTTRIATLNDFLKCQPIDILFLLEVTHPQFDNLTGYTTYTNVGTTMTGTAFMTRNGLQVTNINKIPSGRETTAECEGINY